MNKLTGLEFHHDAGHGWLKVPRHLVDRLERVGYNIASRYSYFDNEFYYLEEDCDAPRFEKTIKEVNGYIIPSMTLIYDGDSSPIRNFSRAR